jgi:predicted PhzF superfamily epimerase YddE/YHI9
MTRLPATRVVQVDVFTAAPYGGNPAGVLVLDGPGGAERWQDDA